jgi:hypothetical protein
MDKDGDEVVKFVEEAKVRMKAEAQARADLVFKPNHYAQWAIEPITFIMRNRLPYHVGNIVKYSVRAGHKQYEGMTMVESEITDLEKAMRYCEMRINELKGKTEL